MRILFAVSLALTSVQAAPFVMFASTSDPQVFPVLEKLFRHTGYIGIKAAKEAPELGRKAGRQHQFILPGSLAGVRKNSGCGTAFPGMVMYDIEHWSDTPESEQSNPGESIGSAARLVHSTKCQQFALAPDGRFIGLKDEACEYDLAAGIFDKIDWSAVDLFSIQAQRLLADRCGDSKIENYATFVSQVAALIRSRNPSTLVVSQLSFRYTPPEVMAAAMQKLASVADGFYFVYPARGSTPCRYCSPDNLAKAVKSIPQ